MFQAQSNRAKIHGEEACDTRTDPDVLVLWFRLGKWDRLEACPTSCCYGCTLNAIDVCPGEGPVTVSAGGLMEITATPPEPGPAVKVPVAEPFPPVIVSGVVTEPRPGALFERLIENEAIPPRSDWNESNLLVAGLIFAVETVTDPVPPT